MKKRYFLFAILTVTLSVITVGSVRRALLFDTKIAYADPSIIYVYGTDGSEHLAICNFYPRTHDYANPSEWCASAGAEFKNLQAQLNMSKKALNACRVVETHCEQEDDNLCPLTLTGVAIITPAGEVHQLWTNPF